MDCKKHSSSNSPFIKVNEWSMYRDMGLSPAQSSNYGSCQCSELAPGLMFDTFLPIIMIPDAESLPFQCYALGIKARCVCQWPPPEAARLGGPGPPGDAAEPQDLRRFRVGLALVSESVISESTAAAAAAGPERRVSAAPLRLPPLAPGRDNHYPILHCQCCGRAGGPRPRRLECIGHCIRLGCQDYYRVS